ncbi:hypothetical protein HED60_13015 [Planctomycetales bacterium ZRK34]|nr:hypothetical protein HED60_13015 [Planctomycetales bacterium ZRK34]
MRTRQVKSWLWLGSGAMALAAVGVVVMAWALPYAQPDDLAEQMVMRVNHRAKAGGERVVKMPPASDPVWATPLRRPLKEPPKQAVAKSSAAPAPPLTVKLGGTVIESGRCVAMFITAAGKVELKAVGEVIEGAKVTEITDEGVRLEHNGRDVRMALPKKGGA